MGVRGRDAGPLLISDEEMEAASMNIGRCIRASCINRMRRLLSCILFLQNLTAPSFKKFVAGPYGRFKHIKRIR